MTIIEKLYGIPKVSRFSECWSGSPAELNEHDDRVPRERNRAADAVAAFHSAQPPTQVTGFGVTD